MTKTFFKLLCGLFALCTSASADEGAHTLRIGVIAPLTGPAADYGVAIRNGIALQEKTLSRTTKRVEFIYEDTAYNARAAVDAFTRLRTVERVDAVYVWGVVFCEALAPMAAQFQVPMIAQCVQPNISNAREQIIRFANPANDYTEKLWAYARSKGYKKISLVLAENAYLKLMADAFEGGKRADESVTIVERYQPPQTDFRSTITKLRAEAPDAIAVFLGPGQIGPFFRQLAEQRISIPALGTNLFESKTELESGGEAVEGAIFANNPVAKGFQESYVNAYGNLSQITFAAYAYDMSALLNAFAPKYSGKPAELIQELVKTAPAAGVCGDIRPRTDPGGGTSYAFPVVLKTVRRGSLEELPLQ